MQKHSKPPEVTTRIGRRQVRYYLPPSHKEAQNSMGPSSYNDMGFVLPYDTKYKLAVPS